MTRLRKDEKYVPVTLLTFPTQEVVRIKTVEKDGYSAVVVGVGKKELPNKLKGIKIAYKHQCEFHMDPATAATLTPGSALTPELLVDITTISVAGISKGKGFQGAMKRHNFAGGPKTHGSKFHRGLGSTGNRKPRRTNKNQPMAGHMGSDLITLKNVTLVDRFVVNGEVVVACRGSLPGSAAGYLHVSAV